MMIVEVIVVTEEIRATFGVRQVGKEEGFLLSLDLIPKKREVATAKRVGIPEPPQPLHIAVRRTSG